MRGATFICWLRLLSSFRFQSTLPVRGATGNRSQSAAGQVDISIHAPREGSDIWAALGLASSASRFQSTLPVRGATAAGDGVAQVSPFQSTLPVRGATNGPDDLTNTYLFQSTLPVRGATFKEGYYVL